MLLVDVESNCGRLVASGGALRNRQGNRVANFADRECTLCGSEQTAKKIAFITEWSQSFIYTPPVDRSQRRTRITTFRVIAVSVSTVCAQEESAPAKPATGMNTDKRMPGMQENMKAMRGMGGHTMMSGGVHGGMMKGGDMKPRREMMEKRMDMMEMMMEQMMLRDLTKQSLPAK